MGRSPSVGHDKGPDNTPDHLLRHVDELYGSFNPAPLHDRRLLARDKMSIAHRIRMERASAMLEAAGVAQGQVPAWMLSAHPLVAEWIRWTSCLNTIVAAAYARQDQDQPLPNGRVEVRRTVGRCATTLRAGIYMGALTGAIELSRQPVARYVDEPAPRLVIARTALPEAVAASINDQGTGSRRLGDIIDHPLVAMYDPPIASVADVDGAVEIALEPGYTTLTPVPVAAMRVVPYDADPGRPWELTARELETLRAWPSLTAATNR